MPGQISGPIHTLGVLTGGGDVPGLNAAIKALVYRAEPMGIRIVGLRAGWKGITYLDRSRSRDSLVFNLEDPGTWQKSYLMPFNRLSTSTTRPGEFINRFRSTAGSHSETVLSRMFGRDDGFPALETALVTWAERVLIPEIPVDIDALANLITKDRRNPQNYSTIVLSEGANLGVPVPEVGQPDAYGHRKKANVAEFLADQLAQRLPGIRFLPIDLTYILRST